jgi:hypothetical protein
VPYCVLLIVTASATVNSHSKITARLGARSEFAPRIQKSMEEKVCSAIVCTPKSQVSTGPYQARRNGHDHTWASSKRQSDQRSINPCITHYSKAVVNLEQAAAHLVPCKAPGINFDVVQPFAVECFRNRIEQVCGE